MGQEHFSFGQSRPLTKKEYLASSIPDWRDMNMASSSRLKINIIGTGRTPRMSTDATKAAASSFAKGRKSPGYSERVPFLTENSTPQPDGPSANLRTRPIKSEIQKLEHQAAMPLTDALNKISNTQACWK